VRRAFLTARPNAKSIAYGRPGERRYERHLSITSLEKLGIAADIKSKLRLVSLPTGQSSPRVAAIGFGNTSIATKLNTMTRLSTDHPPG
jgi:hypothetical protein